MTRELRAPVTQDDWAAYHTIRRRVLWELRGNAAAYDPHHPDEHRPGNHPLVLWDGDAPVGVIRVDVDGAVATFRRVAIRDDRQRRGHGRALLEAAERFARDRGCTSAISHVDPDAIIFYERCGYRRVDPSGTGATILVSKALS